MTRVGDGIGDALASASNYVRAGESEATRRAYHEMGVYTREDDLESYQMLGMLFLGLPEHIKGQKSLFDLRSWQQSSIDLRGRFKADPITRLPADLLIMSRAITLMGGVMFTLDMWYDMWTMIMGFCDRVLSEPATSERPEPTAAAAS